jgi:hypothetical protein
MSRCNELPFAQKKKERNQDEEKKERLEESCFQRKQRPRKTASVFAFLANESTALLWLGQPEAGKIIKSPLRLWPTGSAALFFSGQSLLV